MPASLPSQVKYRTASNLATADVADEAIVLHLSRGMYFGLSDVGAFIWRQLHEPRSIDDLCLAVEHTYDCSLAGWRSDVIGFVEELHHHGLIEAV